jgi:hypothetical protein
MPAAPSFIGRELVSVEKGGTILARAAAIASVRAGAKAAMVQAVYLPGEYAPSHVSLRDERGRDLRSLVSMAAFDLRRVGEICNGRLSLNQEACQKGWVSDASLPWEVDFFKNA